MNYFQPMVLLKSRSRVLDSSKTPEYWWLIRKPSLSWLVYYWRHYEKKRPDSFFNFLFGTKHTLKSSSNTKTNTYVTLLLSKSIFWLVFCTALEPAIQRRYFSKTNWETFYFAIEEGFRKDISAELCNVILLLIFDSHPFNLHPEKWFKGYPVKSTQIFIGCHLRFF